MGVLEKGIDIIKLLLCMFQGVPMVSWSNVLHTAEPRSPCDQYWVLGRVENNLVLADSR